MASRGNQRSLAGGLERDRALAALRRLSIALAPPPPEPPPGFYSANQWGEAWKCNRDAAYRKLTAGLKAGAVECVKVKNHRVMENFYRVKP